MKDNDMIIRTICNREFTLKDYLEEFGSLENILAMARDKIIHNKKGLMCYTIARTLTDKLGISWYSMVKYVNVDYIQEVFRLNDALTLSGLKRRPDDCVWFKSDEWKKRVKVLEEAILLVEQKD